MDKANATATNAEPLVDIDAAALIVNLKRSTLYALTSRRRIPHYKRGGKLYFRQSELVQWLTAGKRDVIDESSASAHLNSTRGTR